MYRDLEKRKEYFRSRHAERRVLAFKLLGGKCKECGSINNLEIDHVDPTLKTMIFTSMARASEKRFLKELENCQLLCGEHHDIKTMLSRNMKPAKGTHGTVSSYKYCKCDLCRKAKSESNKQQNLLRRSSKAAAIA